MNDKAAQEQATPKGAASALDDELGELLEQLDRARLYTSWGEVSSLPGDAADALRILLAKAARWDAIETLMILGDVELTQAEDGGYSIYVEPVESVVPTSWDGDTPDQAADKVVAQLTTPNAEVS